MTNRPKPGNHSPFEHCNASWEMLPDLIKKAEDMGLRWNIGGDGEESWASVDPKESIYTHGEVLFTAYAKTAPEAFAVAMGEYIAGIKSDPTAPQQPLWRV